MGFQYKQIGLGLSATLDILDYIKIMSIDHQQIFDLNVIFWFANRNVIVVLYEQVVLIIPLLRI